MSKETVVRLRIQNVEREEPAFESLPALEVGNGVYRLLNSPGMVLDCASGDVVRVLDGGAFEIVERGGNFCIQVLMFRLDDGSRDRIEAEVSDAVTQLDGWLDGKSTAVRIFTVPATSGFKKIAAAVESVISRYPGARWMFGNAYSVDDPDSLLGWWQENDVRRGK